MKNRITLAAFTALLFGIAAAVAPGLGQNVHRREPATPDQWTQRFQWQMPVRVMKEIGVTPGMNVADIGAGEGYFSFYLADKVGSSGKIFASDIDAGALQTLRERAAREQVRNIVTIQGSETDSKIPEQSVDLALIVNVLPMIDHPKEFFGNIAKALKPNGTLAIIQWAAEKLDREDVDWNTPFRNSLRFYLRQIYDGDFEVVKILTFLPVQNIYICKPRGKD
jgi:ubiquinone/menaquinone biosynthesis C-methylase UbiE